MLKTEHQGAQYISAKWDSQEPWKICRKGMYYLSEYSLRKIKFT